MTSEKQIAANRKNATRSTGPKTIAGKQSVATNAIRHGLLAKGRILDNESDGDFNQLRNQLLNELKPVGILELECCERIVDAIWRLRRLQRVEFGIYSYNLHHTISKRLSEKAKLLERSVFDAEENGIIIENEASHSEILQRLLKVKEKIESPEATLGEAFSTASKSDNFSKLARYERSIEKTLFGTLHELTALQASRIIAKKPDKC